MGLGLLFWIIALVAVLFGAWAPSNPRFAPWAPWPLFVLVLILGWHNFGPPIHQ